MNDTATSDNSEFVSVAEAAKRLRVSLRTAQRYAAKLPDEARQAASSGTTGNAVVVSLVAMIAESEKAAARNVASSGVSRVIDAEAAGASSVVTDGATADTSSGVPVVAADTALVAHLESEIAFLRDALKEAQANVKAEQENTRAALAELHDARRESQVMLGAVAAGRVQIGQQEAEPTAAETVTDALQDVPSDKAGAPWWAFWKKTGN